MDQMENHYHQEKVVHRLDQTENHWLMVHQLDPMENHYPPEILDLVVHLLDLMVNH